MDELSIEDTTLLVSVVFVPNLQQTLVRPWTLSPQLNSAQLLQGKGWSEHQLLTGIVFTLGRQQLDLRLSLQATDVELAHAVEDAWGVAVAEQAYRWRGTALVADLLAPRLLADLGFGAQQRLLLSSGSPTPAGGAQALGSGTATALRSPTQVLTVEADTVEAVQVPDKVETEPFSGQGRRLGGGEPELSVAERRERAAAAALARQR